MKELKNRIYKLNGKVQHYAWGGYEYIPRLLNIRNTSDKPFAEYWMGAHPSASSVLVTPEGDTSLVEAIQNDPSNILGKKTFDHFGELPYLFKVLDVKDMLSIQVHPSKAEAEKGFDAENATGIPLNAPNRNYKDRNHKPEVMVALSEFWLLHGFLQEEELKSVLHKVPVFNSLLPLFEKEGYKGLYQYVMELPQQQVNTMLMPLVLAELQKKQSGELKKNEPGWWVAKLYEGADTIGDVDRGVFSIYFFNIVHVLPGQAVFQGAGIPHAYLEGQNVELMANSDNVLRGGLTPKHIDVPELLKHTSFKGVIPVIMEGEALQEKENFYICPVPDFGISQLKLASGDVLNKRSSSFEIIIVIDGEVELSGSSGEKLLLCKGESAAILVDESYTLTGKQASTAYKAYVPVSNF